MARGAKDRGREGGGGLGMRYKKGLTSAAVITAATLTASVCMLQHTEQPSGRLAGEGVWGCSMFTWHTACHDLGWAWDAVQLYCLLASIRDRTVIHLPAAIVRLAGGRRSDSATSCCAGSR